MAGVSKLHVTPPCLQEYLISVKTLKRSFGQKEKYNHALIFDIFRPSETFRRPDVF